MTKRNNRYCPVGARIALADEPSNPNETLNAPSRCLCALAGRSVFRASNGGSRRRIGNVREATRGEISRICEQGHFAYQTKDTQNPAFGLSKYYNSRPRTSLDNRLNSKNTFNAPSISVRAPVGRSVFGASISGKLKSGEPSNSNETYKALSSCVRASVGRLLFTLFLMICGIQPDLFAQPYFWAKTISLGPSFRDEYGIDQDDCLGIFKYDTHQVERGVVRVWANSHWSTIELSDSGLNGDPVSGDSIFWGWERVHFGNMQLESHFGFDVLLDDSNSYTVVLGNDYFPDFRDFPENLLPSYGEEIHGDTIELGWSVVDDVDHYSIYLWNGKPDLDHFSNGMLFFSDTLTINRIAIPTRQLGRRGDYYWAVIAYDDVVSNGGGLNISKFNYNPNEVSLVHIDESCKSYSIYPTPAHFGFTIASNDVNQSTRYLYLFDIAGRIVYHAPVIAVQNQFLVLVRLPPGVYYAKLINNNVVETDTKPILHRILIQ